MLKQPCRERLSCLHYYAQIIFREFMFLSLVVQTVDSGILKINPGQRDNTTLVFRNT